MAPYLPRSTEKLLIPYKKSMNIVFAVKILEISGEKVPRCSSENQLPELEI